MATKEIPASKLKPILSTALFGIFGLAVLIAAVGGDPIGLLFGVALLALAVGNAWLLWRPPKLVLEDDGFTQVGGFIRTPIKIYWREIREVFVFKAFRRGQQVGYDLAANGHGAPGPVRHSADRRLIGWSIGPAELAVEMEGYRQRALTAAAKSA